jgi:hypothetical protein
MKNALFVAAIAALAITASAQNETKGKPGIVITQAKATPALQQDMKNRRMEMTLERVKQGMDGHLSSAIVGSRKFTVLERQDLDSVLDDPSRLGDSLKLRENDYAVLVKLDSYLDIGEKMTVSGKVLVKRRLQISGQVKIVGGVTAEVLDMSNIQMEETDLVDANITAVDRLDEMLPKLTRGFAEQSYERLMAVAFPMKVIDEEDGVITINRGADFLAKGDVVEIYGAGKVITDPGTGEKIKRKGKLLGTASITSTEPNYSQAKANGAFEVAAGAEVRKPQPEKK